MCKRKITIETFHDLKWQWVHWQYKERSKNAHIWSVKRKTTRVKELPYIKDLNNRGAIKKMLDWFVGKIRLDREIKKIGYHNNKIK